jgi:hypothetical protein
LPDSVLFSPIHNFRCLDYFRRWCMRTARHMETRDLFSWEFHFIYVMRRTYKNCSPSIPVCTVVYQAP